MVFNSEKYVTHMTLIKAQQSIYSFTDRCSVFLSYRINAMLGEIRSDAPSNIELMKTITIIINVMERLFDELVKELALDRFVIVSGSVREKDGRAVRFRKAHLRRRRR